MNEAVGINCDINVIEETSEFEIVQFIGPEIVKLFKINGPKEEREIFKKNLAIEISKYRKPESPIISSIEDGLI